MVKILFWHAEYRGICLGFLYGSEWSVGDADCHSQCAHWLRNDTVNKRCSTSPGGRTEASAPTEAFKGCVGEGLCPSHGRGNRRSAAGGGCSEPVSRKCPDWRTRQWPGIGWHDGGQENPAPTERLQGGGGKKESLSHGFAVPAPFRQGGRENGGTDCHGRCAPSQ